MVPSRDHEPGSLRRPQSLQSLTPQATDAATMLPLSRRPESVPNLPLFRTAAQQAQLSSTTTRVPAKLLLNVTVQRSLGPVQVIISPGSTVADLVRAAVAAYVKEGRRPLLPGPDPAGYELHYSQFSLESLDPQEKLINLGSRNFFLCSKQASAATAAAAATAISSMPSDCRRDEGQKKKTLLPRLMDAFAKH